MNVVPGGTIDVEITFPTPIPAGWKYYKVDSNGFYEFPNAVINGNTVTLTLTDNGQRAGGDNNGVANDGVIVDPGGVAVPAVAPPAPAPAAPSGAGGGGL